MGRHQKKTKKEAQASRDRRASKLKAEQLRAVLPSPSTFHPPSTPVPCPHFLLIHPAHLKPLPARVQSWQRSNTAAASTSVVPPSFLCLTCGYVGCRPAASTERKREGKSEGEGVDAAAEVGSDEEGEEEEEGKEKKAETEEAKEKVEEKRDGKEGGEAMGTREEGEREGQGKGGVDDVDDHFVSTHFVGVDLASPSPSSCLCLRCSLSLASVLLHSPHQPTLLSLSAFISSISSPSLSSSALSSSSTPSSPHFIVPGLQNKGNTCFFNSIVQCLAALPALPPCLSPPSPFPLQTQLSLLLHQMTSPPPSSTKLSAGRIDSPSLNPSSLLSEIARVQPTFKGSRQQDAHELLRALLGGVVGEVEEEERKRKRERLVKEIEEWSAGEVATLVKRGVGGREAAAVVVAALADVAKEEGMAGGADGKLVVELLRKWEMKEGKRWRKAMTQGLSDADRRSLERLFVAMRKGEVPAVRATSADGEGEGEGEGEDDEEGEGEVRAQSKVVMSDSWVHRLFGGVLEAAVECSACHHVSRTEEVFFDLSLPIEPPRAVVVEAGGVKGKGKVVKEKAKEKGKVEAKGESVEQKREREEKEREKERKEEEERQHLLLLEEVTRGSPVTLHATQRRKKQQPSNLGKKKAKVTKAQKKLLKKKGKDRRVKKDEEGEDKQGDKEEDDKEDDKEEGEEEDGEEGGEEEEREDEHEQADSKEQRHPEEEEKIAEMAEEEPAMVPVASPAVDEALEEKDLPDALREEKAGDGLFPTPQQPPEDAADLHAASEPIWAEPPQSGIDEELAREMEELLTINPPSSSVGLKEESEAAAAASSRLPVLPSPFSSRPSRLSGACTLDDCLQSFFDPELLTGSNAFRCSSCASLASLSSSSSSSLTIKRDATRSYYLHSLPPILTIHLKRFASSANGRSLEKLSKPVDYPLQLQLAAYVRGGGGEGGGYELCGVVSHSGGMSGGHYVAYVRRGGVWWYASDAHVKEVSVEEVRRAQAYLLFYIRR